MGQIVRPGVEAFIALGSNRGDRGWYLEQAMRRLDGTTGISLAERSSILETKAIGPVEQGDYLNQVVKIRTSLSPFLLLERLLAIERSLGRVRVKRWGPRTIDLDILFYGDHQVAHRTLQIPHPEIANRPFVVAGLRELGKITL